MASVSKLKRMLDELRFKYQDRKNHPEFHPHYYDVLDEILEDIQKIDSYCHDRNRY